MPDSISKGLLSLFLIAGLEGRDRGELNGPWLTGPLIVPSATVKPFGHYQIEPYLYVTGNTGAYDQHWSPHRQPCLTNINVQVITIIGLTPWMDVQIIPSAFYNLSEEHSAARWGDLPLALDFQLVNPGKWPGIKFTLQETFPTGQYQRAKTAADLSGQGVFATNANVLFYKLFHCGGVHYLSTFLNLGYTINSSVHVHGLNAYGNFSGKIIPGGMFEAIFSFEYTFTQNWVFAIDHVYIHKNSSKLPSSEQISIAPAIEYNFSEIFGIITGAWVTVAGRNVNQFYSGVVAVNWSW